jgi:hypothetical protein
MLANYGFVAVIVGAISLAGCTPPQPPASSPVASLPPAPTSGHPELLGVTAIQALYSVPHREDGVVLHGRVGAKWTKWIAPDGSLRLSAGGGMFTDTGRLAIVGNEVCATWTHIDGGKTSCMHLAKVGPNTYVSYDAEGLEGSKFHISGAEASTASDN